LLDQRGRPPVLKRPVDLEDWAGGITQEHGQPLNEAHGAPLRLRNEREIGFKQVKWIEAIEFVDSFAHLGFGQGGYNEDHEFYGYRMPI
jgi:DMSO/TMAO reductase YedYZ molybdopterin-dependent catalytic subunit